MKRQERNPRVGAKAKKGGRKKAKAAEARAVDAGTGIEASAEREPIEAMSGTRARIGEPVYRATSYVPLSARVPDAGVPPPALPDSIPDPEPRQIRFEDALAAIARGEASYDNLRAAAGDNFSAPREGCYLIRYTPLQASPLLNSLHYDGTMRVERNGANSIASGDLYLHRLRFFPVSAGFPFPRPVEPNPANGIPIFARVNYSYYVRVTRIQANPQTSARSITLGYELHRFTSATSSFALEGTFTATMSWTTAPPGYPSSADYLSGDVKNSGGSVVGTLTMGWVSPYLRRAVVEVDTTPGSERPLNNGATQDWKAVFDHVKWDISIIESNSDVAEPSGESWSDAEMHAAMLQRRDSSNLDAEWRYHILCVRLIDSTPRGIMYDNGATDSNNVPREGVGIATHWMIPDTEDWGLSRGLRFGTATAPFFRTALHEIGHAMGLYHNTVDMGVMNTTDVIARSAVLPEQFPNNIQWSHAPDDQKRLRHMPDIWVRPGGIAFGRPYSASPISPGDMLEEADGLTLSVAPLLETVPIGAPVRIDFKLTNSSDHALPAPASLNIKTGFVKGKVVDPSGTVRSFIPLVRCLEEHELAMLEPGQSVENSVTLLRGPQGSLFPSSGAYRVIVEVDFDLGGVTMGITGETFVMVTPPESDAHAGTALKILSTPDAVLTLALGGDHLPEGISAIHAGLNDEVLRPHYTFIEAKRLGRGFRDRKPDLEAAAELLDEETVCSGTELKRMAQIVQKGGGVAGKKMADLMNARAADLQVSDEIEPLPDAAN